MSQPDDRPVTTLVPYDNPYAWAVAILALATIGAGAGLIWLASDSGSVLMLALGQPILTGGVVGLFVALAIAWREWRPKHLR